MKRAIIRKTVINSIVAWIIFLLIFSFGHYLIYKWVRFDLPAMIAFFLGLFVGLITTASTFRLHRYHEILLPDGKSFNFIGIKRTETVDIPHNLKVTSDICEKLVKSYLDEEAKIAFNESRNLIYVVPKSYQVRMIFSLSEIGYDGTEVTITGFLKQTGIINDYGLVAVFIENVSKSLKSLASEKEPIIGEDIFEIAVSGFESHIDSFWGTQTLQGYIIILLVMLMFGWIELFPDHFLLVYPLNPVDVAIRQEIKQNVGRISDNKYKSIENLELMRVGTNLKGIERCTNLTELFTVFGKIKDISALQNLKELRAVNLHFNEIKDISALQNLTELRFIQLYGNEIEDISTLKNLKQLRKLGLRNNQIEDISYLRDLVNLEFLDLRGNKIVDISPLLDIKWANEEVQIYLDEALFNNDSSMKVISELQEMGFLVSHEITRG